MEQTNCIRRCNQTCHFGCISLMISQSQTCWIAWKCLRYADFNHFLRDSTWKLSFYFFVIFRQQHRVPYAACLILELFQNANDPYIQVYYKNSTEQYIQPLDIPDCGTKCSLNSFYQLYAPILPTQSFDDECLKNNDADWTTVWNTNLENNYGTR